jgi:hypothetical protein
LDTLIKFIGGIEMRMKLILLLSFIILAIVTCNNACDGNIILDETPVDVVVDTVKTVAYDTITLHV